MCGNPFLLCIDQSGDSICFASRRKARAHSTHPAVRLCTSAPHTHTRISTQRTHTHVIDERPFATGALLWLENEEIRSKTNWACPGFEEQASFSCSAQSVLGPVRENKITSDEYTRKQQSACTNRGRDSTNNPCFCRSSK